jgi:hypothetical protein
MKKPAKLKFRSISFVKICLGFLLTITILTLPRLSNLLDKVELNLAVASNTRGLSLLVVVTGGWAMEKYRDDKRAGYLEQVLQSYVSICEAGFNVNVILITYDRMPDNDKMPSNWLPDMTQSKYFCHRLGRPLSVNLELFPFRPIPKTAYNTDGDLAIRPREIFCREKKKFDVFLVQEEDVGYDLNTLNYFLNFNGILKKESGKYHPGLFAVEYFQGEKYVDVILNAGNIFLLHGKPYFKGGKNGGRGYILYREDLLKMCNHKTWRDSSVVQGEFNVEVAMDGWIENDDTLAKSIIFSLDKWQSAGIPHFPGKYINAYMNTATFPNSWGLFHESVQQSIFSSCFNPERYDKLDGVEANVTFFGENCWKDCLHMNRSAHYYTVSWQKVGSGRYGHWINASFICVD